MWKTDHGDERFRVYNNKKLARASNVRITAQSLLSVLSFLLLPKYA